MNMMTKQDIMTILKYDGSNEPLPLKVKVLYDDGSFEYCDITNFKQHSDCFELVIKQTLNKTVDNKTIDDKGKEPIYNGGEYEYDKNKRNII